MDAASSSTTSVAVIAALAIERAPLDALVASPQSSIRVYQCGVGGQRAYDAARSALASGASALISWGVAGGLVPGLAPGTIVLPEQVLTADGEAFVADSRWRVEICRALRPMLPVHDGNLFDTPTILRTCEAKAHAASISGALAADMESAAVGRAARGAGKPFIVLRVILDALGDTLPWGVEQWIDGAGNRRPMAALGSVLRPADWPDLIRLSRRYGRARRTLTESAQVLAPHGFFYPQLAPVGR